MYRLGQSLQPSDRRAPIAESKPGYGASGASENAPDDAVTANYIIHQFTSLLHPTNFHLHPHPHPLYPLGSFTGVFVVAVGFC